jgi:hypothetical protein
VSENIKRDLLEIGWGGVDWIGLAQDRDKWRIGGEDRDKWRIGTEATEGTYNNSIQLNSIQLLFI